MLKIRNDLKQPSVDRKRILQLIEEYDYVSKQLQRSRGHTDGTVTWRDWFRRQVRTKSEHWVGSHCFGYGLVSGVTRIYYIYLYKTAPSHDRMDKAMQQEVRNIMKGGNS